MKYLFSTFIKCKKQIDNICRLNNMYQIYELNEDVFILQDMNGNMVELSKQELELNFELEEF